MSEQTLVVVSKIVKIECILFNPTIHFNNEPQQFGQAGSHRAEVRSGAKHFLLLNKVNKLSVILSRCGELIYMLKCLSAKNIESVLHTSFSFIFIYSIVGYFSVVSSLIFLDRVL